MRQSFKFVKNLINQWSIGEVFKRHLWECRDALHEGNNAEEDDRNKNNPTNS